MNPAHLSKSDEEPRSFLQSVCSLISATIDQLPAIDKIAVDVAGRGYKYPPDLVHFSESAQEVSTGITKATLSRQLLSAVIQFLEARRSHYLGESYFLQDEFSVAEKHYQEAVDSVSESLIDLTPFQDEVPAQLLQSLTAYKIFYMIEALESRAFYAETLGDWDLAWTLHEQEIALSQKAVEIVSDYVPELKAKFEGHIWYARRGSLECLAHLAAKRGDTELSKQYLEEARHANQMSVELNPLWKEYDQGKQAEAS